MKVLLVSEPGENGVFRQVENLTDHLLGKGHAVGLAYSDVRKSDRLDALVQRVTQAGGPALNLGVGNQLQARDFRALYQLWKLNRRFQPDVIHAHSAKAGGLIRLLRKMGLRTPAFYTPHAYYGMGRAASNRTAFFNGIERFLSPEAMTLNTSVDEAEFGLKSLALPPRLQRVVRNGVDTRHFSPCTLSEKKALRAEMGIPPNAVVLGTLGRFSYQKDPVTLHYAFRACAERLSDLHLVHVGAGELRPQVQQYAKANGYNSRVTWIEYLRDPAPFYRILDGFILPSRYEGLSLAVLEAMAMDLPLLLSDAPGNRGFNTCGLSHLWTARIESSESCASAITSWWEDRDRARASNHREIALSHFSQHAQFQLIEGLYQLAIAGNSRLADIEVPQPVP